MPVMLSQAPSRASIFFGWGALGEAAGLLGSQGRGDVIADCGPGFVPGINPSLPGSASTAALA